MADTLNSIVDRSISEFEDDKIKRVGKNAFRGCEVLSSVTLPSVRAIGDKAFKDCTSLEDISVGDNYDGVVSVNDDSFDGCNPVNVIVPKDKVDLYKNSDSWSGFVGTDGTLTVNWGKCGGTEDVIVTYREGEGIWIPNAFLRQAFDYTFRWHPIGEGSTNYYVGEEIGFRGGYFSTSTSSGLAVYNIPQELGKYLYENAESLPNKGYYGQTAENWTRAYKGLAIYPDHIDTSYWAQHTYCWGIGIRTKSDIAVQGYQSNGTVSKLFESGLESGNFYNNMKEGTYYLVAQVSVNSEENIDCSANSDFLQGQLNTFNIDDTGTDHIYLRHFADMTSVPSATNQGKKYTVPSELANGFVKNTSKSGTQGSIYGMKDSFTVNWGKCGGTSDVTVTYKKGEGIWVPYAFLNEPFVTYPDAFSGDLSKSGNEVGWKCYVNANLLVYKLPQVLGEWLYENAESSPTHEWYSTSLGSSGGQSRGYKGIAIYPDDAKWNFGDTKQWGVGIRKKSDIKVLCYNTDGTFNNFNNYSPEGNNTLKTLEEDAYYLVVQQGVGTSFLSSQNQSCKQWITNWGVNDTGNDHIYFRHWNTMTSAPSATNMGEKYTLDNSMFKKVTLPLTVNWGKCGGEEDVIVNYDKDEGLWIPKEFLTLGKNLSELTAYTGDQLFLSDNVTKDTSVGYKTWFGETDYGNRTERNTRSYYHINIYKLPQGLGKYLYENSESNLGTHLDYSSSNTDSSNISMNRNYKGIALYPDTVNDWSSSDGWGIGIRKKSDLCIVGHMMIDDVMTPVKRFYGNGERDVSCIESYSQYQALEDDAYYLVAQASKQTSSNGCAINPILNLFGDKKLYLRHYNTLTAKPNGTTVMGKKYDVPMSLPPDDAKPLGGKIFYIDPTDNGATYTFYDASGNKVKGTTVSELASAKYYIKTGASTSDKVYVYYPEAYSNLQWGFYNIETTSNYNADIGGGKENTSSILSRTDIETDSIWAKLIEVREETGIEDLYIPSVSEVGACRGIYTLVDGKNSFWSSTAGTRVDTGAHVLTTANCYQTSSYGGSRNYKGSMYVFFIRSF